MERTCKVCKKAFTQFEKLTPAKRCPTCEDIIQRRDTIVVSREEVATFPAVEVGLSWTWSQLKPWRKQDFASYKIEIRGATLNSSRRGSGRIVLRSRFAYRKGFIVHGRAMRATHINRKTGKPTTRIYFALDRVAPPQNTPAPVLSYISYEGLPHNIHDESLWSAWATGWMPNTADRTIAILAVVDKDHPVVIDDGNLHVEYPGDQR